MRNAALLLLAAACALRPIHTQAAPGLPAEKIERNVIYGMYSGLALLMDVYHPEKPNGYGLIHISGSGWTRTLDYDAKPLNHAGHVRLEAVKVPVRLVTVRGAGHGPSFKGAIDMPDLDKERVAWLDEYLRNK